MSPLLAGEIPIVGIPQRQIAVKDVRNTVSGYVRDFEEVTDQVVFTLGSSFAINRGTTVDLFFDWEEGGALESVEDPTAFTDYAARVNADGTGTNRTSELNVTAEVSQFNEGKISISYPAGGPDATIYVTMLQVKGTILRATSSTKVTPHGCGQPWEVQAEDAGAAGHVDKQPGHNAAEGRRHPCGDGEPGDPLHLWLVREGLGRFHGPGAFAEDQAEDAELSGGVLHRKHPSAGAARPGLATVHDKGDAGCWLGCAPAAASRRQCDGSPDWS